MGFYDIGPGGLPEWQPKSVIADAAAIAPAGDGASWGADKSPIAAPLTQAGGTLTRDSQAEKWNRKNKSQYETPGFGENFAQQAVRQNTGQMGDRNIANQQYQQFNQQIGQDPGLGAYYDRAKQRTSADMNQQLASRGAYGSSVGLGMVGDAMAGLDAQRAQKEADYMLQQQQLGGQLAGQAGRSMLDWTQGLGGLAGGADRAGLARMGQGLMGARAADSGFLDRTGQAYDQSYGLTALALNALGGNQGGEIAADRELFESARNVELGVGAEGLNIQNANDARGFDNLGAVFDLYGSSQGMF